MRTFLSRTALVTAACLNGCGDKHHQSGEQPAISYAARAPGSDVMPTGETSLRLIAADGPTRLAGLHDLITESGKRCNLVTSAILVAGLDGSDEWRVTCADTGTWSVLLRPAGIVDVRNCSTVDCG
jgi:hypothetical protein